MKLIPYHSELKQYRIWHSATAYNQHSREVEIVEAYTGKEAQQMVRNKFPGHKVGQPILHKKLG